MKVSTLGWLTAAAMTFTSVSVWSLTSPEVTGPGVSADPIIASTNPFSNGGEAGSRFTAGNTLMVEGRLGHAKLAADQSNETFLFMNVRADESGVATTPAPLNLAIVIDKSGSMSGQRMRNAIDAARGMVSRMREGDTVTVIAYDSRSRTVVPSTRVDSFSRTRINRALNEITADGDTCISCGLDEAAIALRGNSDSVNRVLLLSDGEATAGVRDEASFRRIAARMRADGVSISSIGVDVDYNERVMSALALESNGRHYFVENASGLPRIFDEELSSLVKTVANGAEMRVELEPGVEVVRVFDRSFRREGNTLVVPMGTFSASDRKTLLVKVRLPRGAAGDRPVAKVHMTYDDLVTGRAGRCDGALAAVLTSDRSEVSQLDALVAGRVGRAETASALVEANQLFAQGRAADAQRKLQTAARSVRERKKVAARAAPAPRREELEADFDDALGKLDDASGGFAQPPPGAAPAEAEPRKGKVQVRRNQSAADELAF